MNYKQVFEKFLPKPAVDYCHGLWQTHEFEFKIKRARQTKLGDYRHDFRTGNHTITINNDLNPYAFLVTYLHEVAHLITFNEYKSKVNPHGIEWKRNFVAVVKPVLNEETFPTKVLLALQDYFKDPKASSCSDPLLYQVLKQFDKPTDKIFLSQLSYGQIFLFNERKFKKLEKKRTRSVCMEIPSNLKYLIAEIAEVIKL